MNSTFCFADFEIGQTFRSRSIVMERERIISFGEEFDPRPQHLGETAAAASQFGELVASGWHTGAVSMRLYTEAMPLIEGGGQGAGLEGLAWPTPVRAGRLHQRRNHRHRQAVIADPTRPGHRQVSGDHTQSTRRDRAICDSRRDSTGQADRLVMAWRGLKLARPARRPLSRDILSKSPRRGIVTSDVGEA